MAWYVGTMGIRSTVLVCAVASSLAACGRFSFDDATPDAGGDDTPAVSRVTIRVNGTGTGMVVGDAGLSCADTCVFDFAPGTQVTLRGLAQTGSWLAGWSGPCGGNFDCSFDASGTDVTVDIEFSPRPNRVFVTSTTYDGAFGGVALADAACQMRASAALLDGTWISYMSATGVDAVDRLQTSRGWIRMDGAPIADSPARFATGPLAFVPRFDEYGDDVGRSEVWTGTSGGSAATTNCGDWTSNLATDSGAALMSIWGSIFASASFPGYCDASRRFLCVEVGKNVQVKVFPDTGKLAFVTAGRWTPGVGNRDTADALCASEAAAALQSGTFLAALATTSESIASRFVPGTIWRRIDGIRLIRDGTLFSTDFIDVAPELDLAGGVVDSDFWTGTNRLGAVADPSVNCANWTDGTSALNGAMHVTVFTDVSQPAKYDSCDDPLPLLCLQQ